MLAMNSLGSRIRFNGELRTFLVCTNFMIEPFELAKLVLDGSSGHPFFQLT